MENTNRDVLPTRSSRSSLGEPAGTGTLPMNCLNQEGYNMSNAKEFYSKFILEVVPNNAYSDCISFYCLSPVQPMQPRIQTRWYQAPFRNFINAPACMNVMYSHHPLARGKLSGVDEVSVPSDATAFAEARAMRYEGSVRPRLIAFQLPGKPEKYMWIDLSWPIRSILLPLAPVNYSGAKPHCRYAELDFRRMQGRLPTSGWAEEGNQGFSDWVGDNERGLVWDSFAAVMRVDLELLYILLTIPVHMRKPDYNPLEALQIQKWDIVNYNPLLPMNNNDVYPSVSNYPLVSGRRSKSSTVGVAYDTFLSNIHGVPGLQYPPPPKSATVSILNQFLSTALGFVPVCGPLLAMGSALVIKALEDPSSMEVKNLLKAEFGIELMGAIIGSAQSYQSRVKKPTPAGARSATAPEMAKPLSYYGDSAEDYKLNPNIMDPTEEEKKMATWEEVPEKKNC